MEQPAEEQEQPAPPMPPAPQAKGRKKKKHRKTFPAPFDFVEDRVRVRFISVFIAVLVFLMMAFVLVNVVDEEPDITTELTLVQTPITDVFIGLGSLTPRQPMPQLVYAKSKEALPNQTIHVGVKNVYALKKEKLECDTASIKHREGTLQGISMAGVCTVDLSVKEGVTNQLGSSTYDGFDIAGGPPGAYEIEFSFNGSLPGDKEDGTEAEPSSTTQTVTMQPLVGTMFGPHGYSPLDFGRERVPQPSMIRIGVPLPTFSVNLCDGMMQAVVGATVWAFSWHSADFGEMYPPKRTFLRGENTALLANAQSAPSNANGTAVFTGLTVTASTSRFIYLFFYCQGNVIGWRDVSEEWFLLRNNGLSTPKLPFFFKPSYLYSKVESISIDTDVDSGAGSVTVEEGKPLPVQPVVLVSDAQGAPLKGRTVIALIYEADGYQLPELYVPERAFQAGHLPRHKEMLNPVSSVTGDDGKATFTDLGFTVRGKAGAYRIIFVVDGVRTKVPSARIEVTSTVSSVKFVHYPGGFELSETPVRAPALYSQTIYPSWQVTLAQLLQSKPTVKTYFLNPSNIIWQSERNRASTAITLRVTDANGDGVAGKTCKVGRVLNVDQNGDHAAPLGRVSIGINLVSTDDDEPLSGKDGFITLNLALTWWPLDRSDLGFNNAMLPLFKLVFECDGVESIVGPTAEVEERLFLLDPESIATTDSYSSTDYQQRCAHLVTRSVSGSLSSTLGLSMADTVSLASIRLEAVDLYGAQVANQKITYEVVQTTDELSREKPTDETTMLYDVGRADPANPTTVKKSKLSLSAQTFEGGRYYGNNLDYETTNAWGIADFNGRQVVGGKEGTMLLRFVAIDDSCEDCDNSLDATTAEAKYNLKAQLNARHAGRCVSEVFQVKVSNVIGSVGFTTDAIAYSAWEENMLPEAQKQKLAYAARNLFVYPNVETSVKLQVKLKDGSVAANALIMPRIIGLPYDQPQAAQTGTICTDDTSVSPAQVCRYQDIWIEKAAFYESWAQYCVANASLSCHSPFVADRQMSRTYLFRTSYDFTGADGTVTMKIKAYPGAKGFADYAFMFTINGMYSAPLVISVFSTAASLQVIRAPIATGAPGFNNSLTDRSTYVGDRFDALPTPNCVMPHCCPGGQCYAEVAQAVVQVKDSSGNPVQGAVVESIFWPIGTTFNDFNLMYAAFIGTQYETGEQVRVPAVGDLSLGPTNQVYGLRRSLPSNSNGYAYFHMLMPYSAEQGCYKVAFYTAGAGVPGPSQDFWSLVTALSSQVVCVNDDTILNITAEPSVTAVLGQPFPQGPQLKITRQRGRASVIEQWMGMLYNAHRGSQPLPPPYFMAVHTITSNSAYSSGAISNDQQRLLGGDYDQCTDPQAMAQRQAVFMSARGLLSDHGCLYGYKMRGDSLCQSAWHPQTQLTQAYYELNFSTVTWNSGFRGDKLRLTPTPYLGLMYCSIFDWGCSPFPSWLGEARAKSGQVTLDDTPTEGSIIIRSVPSHVTVGRIFQVTVFVGSGSTQTPLPNRLVTASVQAGVPTNVDPTTFFDSQGQPDAAALGAQTARLAGQSPAVLDSSRVSALTDLEGTAKINLRITEGTEGSYTLQFAHGNVQSRKSEQFQLHNDVAQVTLGYSGRSKAYYEEDFPLTIDMDIEVAVFGYGTAQAGSGGSSVNLTAITSSPTDAPTPAPASCANAGGASSSSRRLSSGTSLLKLATGHDIIIEPVTIDKQSGNLSQYAPDTSDQNCSAGSDAYSCQLNQLSAVTTTFVGGAATSGSVRSTTTQVEVDRQITGRSCCSSFLDAASVTYKWGANNQPQLRLTVKKAGTYRLVALVDGIASNFTMNADIDIRSKAKTKNEQTVNKVLIKLVLMLLFATLFVGNWTPLSSVWVYWSLVAALLFHGILQEREFTTWAGVMGGDLERLCINVTFPIIYVALIVVAVWQSPKAKFARTFTAFSDERFEAYERYVREILSAPAEKRVRYDEHGQLVEELDSSDFPTTLHTRTLMPEVTPTEVLAHIGRSKQAKDRDLEAKYLKKKKGEKGKEAGEVEAGGGDGEEEKADAVQAKRTKTNQVAPASEGDGGASSASSGDGSDGGGQEHMKRQSVSEVEQYREKKRLSLPSDWALYHESIEAAAGKNKSKLLYPVPGNGLTKLPGGDDLGGAPVQTVPRCKILFRECKEQKNPDAFFFPSRLLTALAITVLMVGPMYSLFTWRFALSAKAGMKDSITKAKEQIVQFIRQAIIGYKQVNGIELPGVDIDTKVLANLEKFFKAGMQFADAIPPSTAAGIALALLVVVLSWLYLLTDFKHTAIHARRGQFDLCSFFAAKKRSYWYKQYYKASDFPMNMAWNYVMSLVLLTFIFTVIVLVLAWKYTVNIAIAFLQSSVFVSFLVTYLINSLFIKTLFVKKYCIDKDGIINRAAYSYWDLYNFVAKTYLGFITGLLRVIMGTVAAACTIVAVNIYCMPRWFPVMLDAAYYSYLMMLWEYHTFNNPVYRVSISLMERGSKARRAANPEEPEPEAAEKATGESSQTESAPDAATEKLQDDTTKPALPPLPREPGVDVLDEALVPVKKWRWSSYWRLLLLLHHNPQLIRYRAHHDLVVYEKEWREEHKLAIKDAKAEKKEEEKRKKELKKQQKEAKKEERSREKEERKKKKQEEKLEKQRLKEQEANDPSSKAKKKGCLSSMKKG
eukprot:g236.t1